MSQTRSYIFATMSLSLLVITVVLSSCENNSELLSNNEHAQIELELIFNRGESDVASEDGASQSAAKSSSNLASASQIDRVTVSVIEITSQDTVVNAQPLQIVQSGEGLFAEGDVLVPVEPPEQTFTIIVRAFENLRAVSQGQTNITLVPGEVRETPVPVTMLQFPTIFNPRHELVSLNTCNLQDGGDPASSFQVEFDYSDPDSDVNSNSAVVTVNFQFVGGGSGSFEIVGPSISGNGFEGTITTGQCYRYANTNSVDVTLTLTDAGGLTSEPITFNIPRPEGANLTFGMPEDKSDASVLEYVRMSEQP